MAYEGQPPSDEIAFTFQCKELPVCISIYRSFYYLAVQKEYKTGDNGSDRLVIDLQWMDTEEDRAFTTEWKLKRDNALKPEQWTKIHEKISSLRFKSFEDNVVRKLYDDLKACLTAVKGWNLRFIMKSELKMTLMQEGVIAAVFKDFFSDILGNVEFEVSSGLSPVPVEFVERCKSILERLDGKYGPDGRNDLFKSTENRLSEIEARMLGPTSLTVAVHGVTGVGKSSLLNALLDTSSLMPTGALGKSVTSVAIMVEANEKNDKYEADVEFLSKEEWVAELQCLQNDIRDDVDDRNGASDVMKAAEDRLIAVYGKRILEEHLDDYDSELLTKLDTTETLKKEDAHALGEALTTYARNNEDELQYWPLVRKIVIRVPVRSLCGSGCKLVDLPGFGDTNLAREKIGQEYIVNCDLMLIVAHISRVISDKTVADALGENLLRDLRMDQRKAIVVCSHSDQLNSQSEIIKKFDIKEACQLDQEIKTLKIEKQKLKEQRKRNLVDIDEVETIDDRIEEKKRRKMSLCVKARNDYIKKDLQEKLKSELHDPNGKLVDVFCVSSTEYLKYKMQDSDLMDDDDEGMKFSSERDTEIPQLRDYLRSAVEQKRAEAAKKCQEEFRDLVSDLKTYASNSLHPKELEILASEGPKWGKLETEVVNRTEDFMEKRLRELYNKIGEACGDAVPFTRNLRQRWEKDYPHKTYQATVAEHRQGVYSSKRFGGIDLNEQLSEPFFNRIENFWSKAFASHAWGNKLLQEVIQPAEKAIDDWGDKMKAVLRKTSHNEDSINIDEMCANLKRKSLMKSTYEKVSDKSIGKGALREMHKEMEVELNKRCAELYEETAASLKTELDKFKETVKSLVRKKIKEVQTDLDSQMEPIRQKDVIRELQNNIEEINELLVDCQGLVANQESQTSRKRTAARAASGPDGDIDNPNPSTSSETPRPKRMKQLKPHRIPDLQ